MRLFVRECVDTRQNCDDLRRERGSGVPHLGGISESVHKVRDYDFLSSTRVVGR